MLQGAAKKHKNVTCSVIRLPAIQSLGHAAFARVIIVLPPPVFANKHINVTADVPQLRDLAMF